MTDSRIIAWEAVFKTLLQVKPDFLDKDKPAVIAACDAIRELAAIADEIERDARRYSFLRGNGGPGTVRWPLWEVKHWTGVWNSVHGKEMDEAIDEAIAIDAAQLSSRKQRRNTDG